MFLSASRFDCKIAPKGVIFLVECPSYTVVYSGLGLPQGYLSTCLDYAFRGMCSCGSKSHLSLADDRGCAGWCNLRVAQTSPLLVTRLFCLLFSAAGRLHFKGSPSGGIFMVISPSYTIVCRVFGVSLRDNLLPVSITPSGACVVAILSHISLLRLVGSTQVGASSW